MHRYYVINDEGDVSYFVGDKTSENDGPEFFDTLEEAVERAKELAKYAPGEDIHVCQAVKAVCCPLGEVEIKNLWGS